MVFVIFFLIQTLFICMCVYIYGQLWTLIINVVNKKNYILKLRYRWAHLSTIFFNFKLYLCFPAVSKSKPYCSLWGKLWIVWRTPHSYYHILMSCWLNLPKIQNLIGNETSAGEGAAIASAHEAPLCPPDSLIRDIRSMRLVSSSSQLFYSMLPPVLKKNLYFPSLPFQGIFTNIEFSWFWNTTTTSLSVDGKQSEFSVISRKKNLGIVFPESKRVHFPTGNSAPLIYFYLAGANAEFDLRATHRTVFSCTNLLLFPLKYIWKYNESLKYRKENGIECPKMPVSLLLTIFMSLKMSSAS